MYWAARFGLGFAFIVSGMRKLPGVLFTILPTTDPVGHYFFDAMHQTGFYWNFIGCFQIVTGVLVLFNRFVVLSSLLMMPVTANIFLISRSLQIRGTPFITAAMLLGNMLLMAWHYEHYLPILKRA
jgi:uncharacterized membrane protein YphA (DoxX/SURF4 family)